MARPIAAHPRPPMRRRASANRLEATTLLPRSRVTRLPRRRRHDALLSWPHDAAASRFSAARQFDGGCSIKLNSPFSLGACLAGAIARCGPFSLREAPRASWAELRPSDSVRESLGGQDPEVLVRRTRRPTITSSQRRLGVNGTMTPLNLEMGSDPSDRIQAAGRSLAGQVRFLSYATVRLHERLRVPGHCGPSAASRS